MPIYDAAMQYAEEGTPLVVLAGKEYGSGSSRDWAAKGTQPARRARRDRASPSSASTAPTWSGMGVLPLQFADGERRESLGLTGEEEFSITGIEGGEAKEVDRAGRRHGVHGPRAHRHAQGGRSTSSTAGSCRSCCAGCWRLS